MEVDFIGIDKVINHIRLTGLTKFTIERIGTNKGTVPVYELLNSNTNDKAINVFANWAENVNSSMPYKLTLFDKVETTIDEQGNEKKTKSKNKLETSQVYFRLNADPFNAGNYNANANYNIGAVDRESIKRELLNEVQSEQSLKNQIAALSEKVDKILNEEEEEETEEQSNLNGFNHISNIITLLQGLNLIKPMNNNKQAINGIENDNADNNNFKNNLNKAIKVLYKNNPNLDTDLLKLADISEKQPATFNMLLNTLRNM